MKNLQIDNIPEDLHQRLQHYAHETNRTISEVAIIAIQRELERWEWRNRLAQRPKTILSKPAAELLAQQRASSMERMDEWLRS